MSCEDKCCEGGKYIKGAKGNDGANIIDAKANSAADGKSFTLDFLLDNGRSLTTAPISLPEGGAGGGDLTALIAAINAAAGNGSLKNIADAIGKISGGSGSAAFIADNRTIKGGTQAEPAAVQVSKDAGNALIAKNDGLYAAQGQGGAGGTVKTDNDTLAGDGSAALPLRVMIDGLLSSAANNALAIRGGKLYMSAPSSDVSVRADYHTISGNGTLASPLAVMVSALPALENDNALEVRYDQNHITGALFVPKSSGGLDSVAVSDTADIALTGTGAAATPLTAALTATVKGNIQQGVDAKSIADAANKTALDAANQINGKLNNDFTRGDGKDFEAANGKVLTAQNGKAVWADPQGGEAAIDQTARDAAAAAQVQANKAGKDASDALGTANAAQTTANSASTKAEAAQKDADKAYNMGQQAQTTANAAKAKTDTLKALAFKDRVAQADIEDKAVGLAQLNTRKNAPIYRLLGIDTGDQLGIVDTPYGNVDTGDVKLDWTIGKSGSASFTPFVPIKSLISTDADNKLVRGKDGKLYSSGGEALVVPDTKGKPLAGDGKSLQPAADLARAVRPADLQQGVLTPASAKIVVQGAGQGSGNAAAFSTWGIADLISKDAGNALAQGQDKKLFSNFSSVAPIAPKFYSDLKLNNLPVAGSYGGSPGVYDAVWLDKSAAPNGLLDISSATGSVPFTVGDMFSFGEFDGQSPLTYTHLNACGWPVIYSGKYAAFKNGKQTLLFYGDAALLPIFAKQRAVFEVFLDTIYGLAFRVASCQAFSCYFGSPKKEDGGYVWTRSIGYQGQLRIDYTNFYWDSAAGTTTSKIILSRKPSETNNLLLFPISDKGGWRGGKGGRIAHNQILSKMDGGSTRPELTGLVDIDTPIQVKAFYGDEWLARKGSQMGCCSVNITWEYWDANRTGPSLQVEAINSAR